MNFVGGDPWRSDEGVWWDSIQFGRLSEELLGQLFVIGIR